jgi:CubicO group peptidase (beta-lactamase class C family)
VAWIPYLGRRDRRQDNKLGGRQIISSQWIDMATTPSAVKPDYGYMWWLTPDESAEPGTPASTFAARGYGSNIVWIDTQHDLVVVLRWFGGNAQEFFGLLVEAVEAGNDR